ncbi:MAG: hypothetical protein LUF90_08580 [Rikenellaceae bacterium]|nr:hypothetical protein [Rikenellaceae bacterium]
MKLTEIKCPRCRVLVRIPKFWLIGLEGVFYCKQCKKHFKIDYRIGAVLSGIGFAASFAVIQFTAYFTSAFTMIVSVVLFLPLGVFFSFLLRRTFLVTKNNWNKQ